MRSVIRSVQVALPMLIALIALLMPLSAFAASFAEGLVVYLPFDEGNGDVAKDLSGNKHDGEIDKPEWVKGKFEKALQFKGANSGTFVTVESTPKLNVNTMTFMAWVNAETWDGTRQIVGNRSTVDVVDESNTVCSAKEGFSKLDLQRIQLVQTFRLPIPRRKIGYILQSRMMERSERSSLMAKRRSKERSPVS